ncbi:MAG: dipeptidase [Pseudomonadales bacterium]|nr:dipeptidase [Pseudomonadales bacterium]
MACGYSGYKGYNKQNLFAGQGQWRIQCLPVARLVVSFLAMVMLAIGGCSHQNMQPTGPSGRILAEKYLLVDTHIDVPFRIRRTPEDISKSTEFGQFDYPRAVAGGLNAPFMSIYIPVSADQAGTAITLADELIDYVESLVEQNPAKFALAYNTQQIRDNFAAGKISLPMGMENGAPIAGDLSNLVHFYQRGIRYITLAHSKSNHIADSSYDDNKQWGGLSKFGKELVPAMNNIGIMIDISHVSDAAFYDVLAISQVPVIASHSSARHFIPGFERNMDDDMLRALAANKGVMQLNIGSTFVNNRSRQSKQAQTALIKTWLLDNNVSAASEAGKKARQEIQKSNPIHYANLSDVLDHVDHVVKIAGIDHVGIGSDFDGVGDTLPTGFKDVSYYPAFIDGLISRGYTEQEIAKIMAENLMRVWQIVEAHAKQHNTTPQG